MNNLQLENFFNLKKTEQRIFFYEFLTTENIEAIKKLLILATEQAQDKTSEIIYEISDMKSFINSRDHKNVDDFILTIEHESINEYLCDMIYDACRKDDLKKVKSLFSRKVDISSSYYSIYLNHLLENGQIDMFKYFLFELDNNDDLSIDGQFGDIKNVNQKLVQGNVKIWNNLTTIRCFFEDQQMVDYKNLMTNDDSISSFLLPSILNTYASIGNIDAFTYILSIPEFQDKIDIHFNKDNIFRAALNAPSYQVLEYIILQDSFTNGENIQEHLEQNSKHKSFAISAISKKQLKTNLEDRLNTTEKNHTAKKKI